MTEIIAAIRTKEEFEKAITSEVDIIFDLSPDLLTLKKRVDIAHENNKKLFIHMDFATGIGKDKSGITYVKHVKTDGVISTRTNIIKIAGELGINTVQRFFMVDSHAVLTTLESLKSSKADMIEVMPGIAAKPIKILKDALDIPVIAGGFIETVEEVESALKAGAFAVSTGKEELWSYE